MLHRIHLELVERSTSDGQTKMYELRLSFDGLFPDLPLSGEMDPGYDAETLTTFRPLVLPRSMFSKAAGVSSRVIS